MAWRCGFGVCGWFFVQGQGQEIKAECCLRVYRVHKGQRAHGRACCAAPTKMGQGLSIAFLQSYLRKPPRFGVGSGCPLLDWRWGWVLGKAMPPLLCLCCGYWGGGVQILNCAGAGPGATAHFNSEDTLSAGLPATISGSDSQGCHTGVPLSNCRRGRSVCVGVGGRVHAAPQPPVLCTMPLSKSPATHRLTLSKDVHRRCIVIKRRKCGAVLYHWGQRA